MEIQYYNNNNNNNNNNMKIIPLSFNIHQQNQYLYSIVSFQVWKPIVHIIKLPSLKWISPLLWLTEYFQSSFKDLCFQQHFPTSYMKTQFKQQCDHQNQQWNSVHL